MSKLVLYLPFAIVITIYASYSLALMCYDCNSHFYPECYSDPSKNASFLVDCGNSSVCRKIHQTISFTEDGMGPDDRIIRYCGSNHTHERSMKPCISEIGLGTEEEVCTCYTDRCNSAESFRLGAGVLLASAVSLLCFNW